MLHNIIQYGIPPLQDDNEAATDQAAVADDNETAPVADNTTAPAPNVSLLTLILLHAISYMNF